MKLTTPTHSVSCILILLCLTGITGSGQAAIGDVASAISVPFTPNDGFAHDQATGRFHVRSGTRIARLDGSGSIIDEGFVSSALDAQLDVAFSRGFDVVNNSTWLGLSADNTLTWWTLDNDMSGDLTIAQTASRDLSGLLDISRSELLQKMALDADGSVLFVSRRFSPDEFFVVHTDSQGTVELARYPLSATLAFGFGGVSSSTHDLAVDGSGRLIIRALGYKPATTTTRITDSDVYWHLLERVGNQLVLAGRTPSFQSCDPRGLAGGNGVLFVCEAGALITAVEMSVTALPALSDLAFDPRGVFWDQACTSGAFQIPKNMVFSVDWRGAEGRVNLAANMDDPGRSFEDFSIDQFSWLPAFVAGNGVTLPYSLDRHGTDPRPMWVEIMNGDGQSSGLIATTFAPTTYQGDFYGLFRPTHPSNAICALISFEQSGGIAKWSSEARWPAVDLNGTITVPAIVPFIGGKEFGVKKLGAELAGGLASAGTDKVLLSGGGDLQVGQGALAVKLGGGAVTELTPQQINYPSGLINITIAGGLSEDIGLLDAFPSFITEPLKGYPFFKPAIELVNRIARLEGSFTIEGQNNTTITAHPIDGSLSLDSANDYSLILLANAKSQLPGGVVNVSAFGEGRSTVTIGQSKTVPSAMEIRNIALRFLLSAKIVVFGATRQFSHPFMWMTADPPAKAKSGPRLQDTSLNSGWQYRYGGSDGLAKSHVILPEVAATPAKGTGNESIIMTGLRTDASPQTARSPTGTALVVWEQEVSGLPAIQATDIFFSYFDGSSWSPAAPIASDTRADFTPQVAWHHSGVWVALWVRTANADLQSSGDPLADAGLQIEQLVPAYAVFDPTSRVWSTPIPMETTGSHFSPKLGTGPSHDVTAMWIHDPEQRLVAFDFGDPNAPDVSTTTDNELRYARFAGGVFPASAEARLGGRKILDFAVADNGTEIAIAAVNMTQADPGEGFSALADLLIGKNTIASGGNTFFTQYQGSTSFNARQVRLGPQLIAMSDASWRVMWKQFDHRTEPNRPSLRISNSLANIANDHRILYEDPRGCMFPPCAERSPRGSRLNDALLTDAGGGSAMLVLPDYHRGNAGLAFLFDDAPGMPSGFLRLGDDEAQELSYSIASDGQGNVTISYLKVGISRSSTMVDEGGASEPYTVVNGDATGTLVALQRQIVTDLAPGETRLAGGLVRAGFPTVIETTVRNKGDRTIMNPTVSIFARPQGATGESAKGEGTKGAADILIAQNVAVGTGMMPGHSSATASASWTVPADGSYSLYAIVDPNNQIAEDDETNNTATPAPAAYPVNALIYRNGFE